MFAVQIDINKMENQKTVEELKLHEFTTVFKNIQVIRVPSGWIYCLKNHIKNPVTNIVEVYINNVFVPEPPQEFTLCNESQIIEVEFEDDPEETIRKQAKAFISLRCSFIAMLQMQEKGDFIYTESQIKENFKAAFDSAGIDPTLEDIVVLGIDPKNLD